MNRLCAIFALLFVFPIGCQRQPETLSTSSNRPVVEDVTSEGIRNEIASRKGKIVVLNAWATWCDPCTKEMPLYKELSEQFAPQGFSLLLVSADPHSEREEIRSFLSKTGLSHSFLKNEADSKFINSIHPKWTGSLPATFVYDREGKMTDFWEGELKFEKIRERLSKPFLSSKGVVK